jgi:Ca-activated chloride channel family protein
VFLPALAPADETYSKNAKANRLYKEGRYEEALKLYEDALLESPGEHRLSMNKGSAQYKMEDYAQAEDSYRSALGVKDKKALADLHYNLGNALFRHGELLENSGGQEAMEKYKEAYEQYIKALDMRPADQDAKWNLQLAYRRMKEMEKRQQNQQNNGQNKDNKEQNNDKNNQQKQDQNDQQKNQDTNEKQQENKDQKNDKKEQKSSQDQQGQNNDEEKKQPRPQQQQQDMEKKEAARLLEQYADDDKELNKPQQKVRAARQGAPEKDW